MAHDYVIMSRARARPRLGQRLAQAKHRTGTYAAAVKHTCGNARVRIKGTFADECARIRHALWQGPATYDARNFRC